MENLIQPSDLLLSKNIAHLRSLNPELANEVENVRNQINIEKDPYSESDFSVNWSTEGESIAISSLVSHINEANQVVIKAPLVLMPRIDGIDNRTDERVCVCVHPGPDQVPSIDKQTFPLIYKFGLNLVLQLLSYINLTTGGECG